MVLSFREAARLRFPRHEFGRPRLGRRGGVRRHRLGRRGVAEPNTSTLAPSRPGLELTRTFTEPGTDVYGSVEWETRHIDIRDAAGELLHHGWGEVPTSWSQTASDILLSKYLRVTDPARGTTEHSLRQVIDRMVFAWSSTGARMGVFAGPADRRIFEDEVRWMLLHQVAAPNSPQWYNTGLALAYGVVGPPIGQWYVENPDDGPRPAPDCYTYPQAASTFILGLDDSLLGVGGVVDLLGREARVFAMGSGCGTNYSGLRARGERVSLGGGAGGPMEFLHVSDRLAAAIQSGGPLRRAAKMVLLDADHPDVEEFIAFKAREERKVQTLVDGGLSARFDEEAYRTVAGQNANNSLRIPDPFFRALELDGEWELRGRVDASVGRRVPSTTLWRELCDAIWVSADPGVHYETTIDEWHTCSGDGRIRASNSCSEFMFLEDTACNLASLNLVKLCRPDGQVDADRVRAAARIWTIVLEITVSMSGYPSAEVARNTHAYRPLGLGFTNLGAALMRLGLPYDSDRGRGMAAGVAALLSAEAYATSADLARALGPFPRFAENRTAMLRVVRNHRHAAYGSSAIGCFEGVSSPPKPAIDACSSELAAAAREAWESAVEKGEAAGFRNAQVSVVAPSGTIGLLMDCDTTGIEPEFGLVKDKHLAGGGQLRMVNRAVAGALEALGYGAEQRERIVDHVVEHHTVEGAPGLQAGHLEVFDCAHHAGTGSRSIGPDGHIDMMAAIQPFISGAISKTVNLPADASRADISATLLRGWRAGLKAVSIYRDGSKLSQPLSTDKRPSPEPDPT